MVNDFELGFFPTKGRYPAEVVAQALEVRGEPPLAVMHVDARALARLFRRHAELEAELDGHREPGPAWFGHRKVDTRRDRRQLATHSPAPPR